MWLTRLAELAEPKYGLRVVFEPGWRTRGASGGQQMKAVQGVLFHHDVAPKSGTYPLRAMLRDGRKGLSGPLCHIGFDRDGVVHVVGAGKANHAGTGKVPGVVRNGGNTRLIGIEMTSTGRGDWTAAQLREMPKLGRALNAIFGLDASQHWSHREYSDSGKIDPYGLPGGMAGLRDRIRAARTGGLAGPGGGMSVPLAPTAKPDPARPWLTSSRVKGMTAEQVRAIQAAVGVKADGKYGDATGGAVKALQEAVGLTADGIYGPTTEAAMATLDDISKKLDQLPKLVWGIGGGPHAPMINRRFEKGSEYPETTLGSMTDRIIRQHIVPLRGEVAGLGKAIEQIGKGEPVDLDAVRAAARAGVADALGEVTADVQVTVKGD